MIRAAQAGARACLLAVAAALGLAAALVAQEPVVGIQAEEAADFARRAALAALHGPPKVFLESIDADGILRRLLGSPVWSGLTERQRALLRTVVREHFAQSLAPMADASAEVAFASVADSGKGPVFLVLDTYRLREHCGPNFDNDIGYRSEAEYLQWKARDPIALLQSKLVAARAIDTDSIATMEAEMKRDIDAAFEFARAAPLPDPATAALHVYA